MKNRRRSAGLDLAELQRYIAISIGTLLIVFIIAQFVVLDLAGVHGPEISKLRAEQEELKIQNDLKRSKINKLRTTADIETKAGTELGLVQTQVQKIELPDTTVAANN
ncbi:hypothetical protein GF389_01430 [Candidatus Dojkabacteria bacterium]|nr:hypothetical protein [Candidatus Dojkabacteria bacterium]